MKKRGFYFILLAAFLCVNFALNAQEWSDTIGTGTVSNGTSSAAPINIWYRSVRTQSVYTAAELNAAGIQGSTIINGLAFFVTGAPVHPLPNFRIRIKHTNSNNAGSHDTGPFVEAYLVPSYAPVAGGWNQYVFSTPFAWNGESNLLIDTAFAQAAAYNGSGTQRTTIAVNGMRYAWNDDTDQTNATTNYTTSYKPQIQLRYLSGDFGSVSGVVRNETTETPLSDVNLSIDDTQFTAVSGQDGTFAFPFAPAGNIIITAVKDGFLNESVNVTVVTNEESNVTINMEPLPQITVSGRIVGSDAPNTGLEGANVTLTGQNNYQATTNAQGNFTFNNVYGNLTYTLNASLAGYQAATEQIVAGTTNINTGDIILNEIAYPVSNVTATVNAQNNAHLTWSAPSPDDPDDPDPDYDSVRLRQHSNEVDNAYFQAYNHGYGVAFYLADYQGALIDKVDFHHDTWGFNGVWQYRLHIVNFDNNTLIQTLGPFTTTGNSTWETNIDLGNIPAQNEFVGIVLEPMSNNPEDAYPCLSGDGERAGNSLVVEIGNWGDYQLNGGVGDFLMDLWILVPNREEPVRLSSVSRNQLLSASTNNENARVNGRYSASDNSSTDISFQKDWVNSYNQSHNNNTYRSLLGYKVYRFIANNQDNPNSWTLLTTINSPTTLSYTDTTWSNLDPEIYRFAVRAVYSNDVLAEAAFSNTLSIGMSATVTVNVSTNSQDPVAGARVTFTNTDGDPNHTYQANAPANGVVLFPNVERGTYNVSSYLSGFNLYTAQNIVIDGDTFTHNIQLTELLLPATNLQYSVQNENNVVLNWSAPVPPGDPGDPGNPGESQWIHWDDGENYDSIGSTTGDANFTVASRYSTQNINDLDIGGMYLNSIKFWPNEAAATYTLKVWRGGSGNPLNHGQEVHSQIVNNPNIGTWNEIALTTPVQVIAGQEFWFGYNFVTPVGHPGGCDAGPAVANFGDLININNQWHAMSELGISSNWNLQGYVTSNRDDSGFAISNNRRIGSTRNELGDRSLLGYKIKRNETTIQELVTALTYTDTNVPNGNYVYSVIAKYTTGEAVALVTPQININVQGEVLVSVTGRVTSSTNPDTGVANAQVTLTGAQNYQGTTNATGNFTINNVTGNLNYMLTITAQGYETYTAQVNIGANNHNMGTIVITAITPVYPPVQNVAASITMQDNAYITWQAPAPANRNTRNSSTVRNSNILSSRLTSLDTARLSERNTRNLTGYKVYRFLSQNEDSQLLWTEVANITNTGTLNYTDTNWSGLDPGSYKYAVRAVYNNTNLSEPTISNTLENNVVTTQVITTVTTNSGDSALGASVTLTNNDGDPDHVYSATAPANGVIQFNNVVMGTYSVSASLSGYENYTQNNVLIDTDPFTHSLELIERLIPAVGLDYAISDGNTVNLTWLAPGSPSGEEQWMSWDQGHYYGAYGTGGSLQFTVASRYSVQNITDLGVGGLNITSVKFWPNSADASYTIKIWKGGSVNPWNPGNEVYSQAVPTFDNGTWNEIPVTASVSIDEAQEIWIGYAVNTQSGYPAGFDFGPAVDGFGNMLYRDGTWNTLQQAHPGFSYNWLINAYAGSSREDSIEMIGSANATANNRGLLGYMVKRNQTILTNNTSQLSFTDYNVPFGNHTYSVTARYSSGDAEPVFSEEVIILSAEDTVNEPLATKLIGNYPNPFNPDTNISFSLKDEGSVTLEIYNTKGQRIKTLLDGNFDSGYHTISWNGKDANEQEVGSGIFFYRIKTGTYSATKKMILIK